MFLAAATVAVGLLGAVVGTYALPHDSDARRWCLLGCIVLGVLLLVGTLTLIVVVIIGNVHRSPSQLAAQNEERVAKAAKRFVQRLHRRWFPDLRGLDVGHRVSLFMLRGPPSDREWTCVARTIHDASKARRWPVVDDIVARATAGVVNLCVVVVEREDGQPIRPHRSLALTEVAGSASSAERHPVRIQCG